MANVLDLLLYDPKMNLVDTIHCSDATVWTLEYEPQAAQPRSIEQNSMLRNGSIISKTTVGDVTETVQTLFKMPTDGDMTSIKDRLIRAFNLLNESAGRQQRWHIFAHLTLMRETKTFRTEIKRAHYQATDATAFGWPRRTMPGTITWTREHFWEETVERALALRSYTTAKTTAGVTIENRWDATHGTWVEVLGADLPGRLKTPIRFELTNTYSGTAPQLFYVSHNSDADPTNLNLVLEAEAADWVAGSSTISNAAYSNGAAKAVAWTSSAEVLLGTWTLSSDFLASCGGEWYRVLAKFASVPETAWLRADVAYQNLTVLGSTPWIQCSSQYVQDLGAMQLPPWGASGAPAALVLRLYGRKSGGSGFTMDFIHLMPARSMIEYRARGYGLPQAWTLCDDGIKQELTVINNASQTAAYWTKKPNDGPLLQPGRTQRLYILHGDQTQTERTLTVKAYYRERREVVA